MGKYIVFSDLHAHLFNDFAKPDEEYINTRLANIVHALRDILKIAKEEGRTVLFAGDLFHARSSEITDKQKKDFLSAIVDLDVYSRVHDMLILLNR